MGGDSSKHAGAAPGQARNRERKRGGLASALAGSDCRAGPLGDRSARVGPIHGEPPDSIPSSPMNCSAVPVAARSQLDAGLTWIPDTEATLIAEWNRERLEHGCGGSAVTAGAGAAAGEAAPPHGGPAASAGSAKANATPTPATPGLTSSSTCPGISPLSPSYLHTSSGLSTMCDAEDVLTGRTTGLAFRVSTTWTQLHPPRPPSRPASGKSGQSSNSPKAPVVAIAQQLQADLTDASASPPPVVTALPVGLEYFRTLQTRWIAPAECAMPPAADEEDLSDSAILEAVAEANGEVLSPPVPLGYMIDLFVPQWRSEGLYEEAQDYQNHR